MNILAVIPARMQSTRLPGKPLMEICGEPMLYWVYKRVSALNKFSSVVCAIDSEEIETICIEKKMHYIMTSSDHPNHISRVHEVSEHIKSDYYMCVNGDEPLIDPKCIEAVFPDSVVDDRPVFKCAMRTLTNPAETIDSANIKVVTNSRNEAVYLSRTPVPYPKGSLLANYKKYVGIECFNKSALDFFVNTPMGIAEKVEDIDQLRFIENGVTIQFVDVQSDSISVDTYKDLEIVRKLMYEQLQRGD